jgi:hypothetical protein
METFPDPTNSPAYHTHTLTIRNVDDDYEQEGSWLQAFFRVERLFLLLGEDSFWTLVHTPFHKLMPSLKSLHVLSSVSYPHAFNLVRSLPLLEDLSLRGVETHNVSAYASRFVAPPAVVPSSTSPLLNGNLYICVGLVERTLFLLLDLPGGLNFRKVTLSEVSTPKDLQSAARLVAACSATLESLHINYDLRGMPFVSSVSVAIHLTLTSR